MPKHGKRRLFRRHLKRKLSIRPLGKQDLPELARLFHETVRRIDKRHYPAVKLRAWSPRVRPTSFWRLRLKGQSGFAAQHKRKLVGFATLAQDGEIDLLYVHRKRQGRGIGRALVDRMASEARQRHLVRLSVNASVVARPFFEALGFRSTRIQVGHVGGRPLRQYRMERRLG